MPKIVSTQQLDQIVELIAQYPAGIGMEALAQAIGTNVPRRTLQRRMATLIELKRIRGDGEGRATRYLLAPISASIDVTDGADVMSATVEVYVPVSPNGEEIKNYVRQPRQQRKPVSYQIGFLEQYRPNQTATPTLRASVPVNSRPYPQP